MGGSGELELVCQWIRRQISVQLRDLEMWSSRPSSRTLFVERTPNKRRVAPILSVRSPLWPGVCWFSVAEGAGNIYYFPLSLLSTGKPTWFQRDVSGLLGPRRNYRNYSVYNSCCPDPALTETHYLEPARD